MYILLITVPFCYIYSICYIYNPLNASSYLSTPGKLKEYDAVVNINNKNDEKCFYGQ